MFLDTSAFSVPELGWSPFRAGASRRTAGDATLWLSSADLFAYARREDGGGLGTSDSIGQGTGRHGQNAYPPGSTPCGGDRANVGAPVERNTYDASPVLAWHLPSPQRYMLQGQSWQVPETVSIVIPPVDTTWA
jgi:hypothetical protein